MVNVDKQIIYKKTKNKKPINKKIYKEIIYGKQRACE